MGAIAMSSGRMGLMRLVSNRELADRERSKEVTMQQAAPELLGLSRHLLARWSAAKRAKVPVEQQMLRNLRQRSGVYEPSKLLEIREMGGSEIYMMLTSLKCRAAEALLSDILLPSDDKMWEISPTPIPSLPGVVENAILQQVMVEAQQAGFQVDDTAISERLETLKQLAMERMRDLGEATAERMSAVMQDQMEEGNWYSEFPGLLYDFVTYKACIMKGPFLRKRPRLQWAQVQGKYIPIVTHEVVPEFERRSPFDIYPGPRSKGTQHSYLFDYYELTREDLQSMKGVPGYNSAAIDEALQWYGDKGHEEPMYNRFERAILEDRSLERLDPEGHLATLNYWGSASGRMLLDWGDNWAVDIDPSSEYQIEAWMIGRYVIKAVLNPDPLSRKPYSKCAFEEIPGAFWGKGLPEIVVDAQDMCNASARSIANNMAIASGPQTEINVDRLADGATVTKLFPWKIHQTITDPTGNNQPAVRFDQPASIVQELMATYQHFARIADEVSGIPSYTYGDSQVGGAGRTASGLSMLMGSASKQVKDLVKGFDNNLIEPRVRHLYEWNMQFNPDQTLKGDLRVLAKGVRSLLVKEQLQMRRGELLQQTANPIDAQIIGFEGRRVMLRETLKSSDMPVDKILPSKDRMALEAKSLPQPFQMMGKQGPNAPGGGQGEAGPPGMTGNGGTPIKPATLDNAGNPVVGQDTRSFNQG